MGLKTILTLGFIFLDLFIAIWLISLIGLKLFAVFVFTYMIFLVIWSIVHGLMGNLNNKDWFKAYTDNNNKVNFKKLLAVPLFLIVGMAVIYLAPSNAFAFLMGCVTALFAVTFLLTFCMDFLYMTSEYIEVMEEMLINAYPKWFKK